MTTYESDAKRTALKNTIEIVKEVGRGGFALPGDRYIQEIYDKLLELEIDIHTAPVKQLKPE